MESKSKENRSSASLAEWLLWFWAGTGTFSGIMWTLTEPDNKWLWFSRYALGAICFGFAGVIRAIRKSGEKDD